MKERPILFSAPMVQAILNGSKWQTRRVVKGRWADLVHSVMKANGKWVWETMDYSLTTPYGKLDDQLWVRETFEKNEDGYIFYKSDCEIAGIKWTPSIHMRREYSRIDLKIKNIRVERLQDISRGDCMAEGCPFPNIAKETNPVKWYQELWDLINGQNSWAENPWVWVVEFERVRP